MQNCWRKQVVLPLCLKKFLPRLQKKCLKVYIFQPLVSVPVGHCDGQVLVMHDMLGINTEFKPRFLRQYLNIT